jgi:NAD(P)-dependent dehydrogenase (short-subunit alcohol dehydrogenase family)
MVSRDETLLVEAGVRRLERVSSDADGHPARSGLAFERTRRFTVLDMTQESTQKTWIITGASSGLGRALAEAALDAGEAVVATARRLERFADLTERYPDSLLTVAHDVRDTGAAQTVIDAALARFGRVDVLLNNAGVGQLGAAEEVGDEALRDMLAQHLFGPAALVRATLPSMREAGHGAIVQMSSQGGRRTFPGFGSYAAGKFALEGWSEALAAEVAPFGIRVLIVEPSRFRTGFNDADVLAQAPMSAVYDGVLGGVRAAVTSTAGQQGDPVRGAAVIRQVLNEANPPLRLPLGAEAVVAIGGSYRAALADVDTWAALSASADFPAA